MRNKTRAPTLATPIQHSTRVQLEKLGKKKKQKASKYEKENKLFLFADNMVLLYVENT